MSDRRVVGTRIRERRLSLGIKQADLAKQAGVSPSYLNLIEHNRRRIGGKTLLKLAEALSVESALLSDGVGAQIVNGLHAVAAVTNKTKPEVERADEFAARFPGWAQLLGELHREREDLMQAVTSLTDRMAHDPQLASSLHEVISAVTAIHSAASILVETKELEPEWQGRFHRNINEDSKRLAEGAEALVRYLEGSPEASQDIRSPSDELHAFLESREYYFPTLEESAAENAIEEQLEQAKGRCGPAALSLLKQVLKTYALDAAALPRDDVLAVIAEVGCKPGLIAARCKAPLPQVFRRLAFMPSEMVGQIGLMICDASGAILLRKQIDGFALPRSGNGCALWPIYQGLAAPQSPISVPLRQVGQEGVQVQAYVACEQISPADFTAPAVTHAHMLLIPNVQFADGAVSRQVGLNCSICSVSNCQARREPSLLSKVF